MYRQLLRELVLLALFLMFAGPAFADAGKVPIFREVQVRKGSVIVLGERFSAGHLSTAINESTYELRKGAFSGSKGITVTVADGGIVRQIVFTYESTVSFPQVVSSYRRSLGEPAEMGPKDNLNGVYWSDSRTRFEVLKPGASNSEVISRLIDLTSSK